MVGISNWDNTRVIFSPKIVEIEEGNDGVWFLVDNLVFLSARTDELTVRSILKTKFQSILQDYLNEVNEFSVRDSIFRLDLYWEEIKNICSEK